VEIALKYKEKKAKVFLNKKITQAQ